MNRRDTNLELEVETTKRGCSTPGKSSDFDSKWQFRPNYPRFHPTLFVFVTRLDPSGGKRNQGPTDAQRSALFLSQTSNPVLPLYIPNTPSFLSSSLTQHTHYHLDSNSPTHLPPSQSTPPFGTTLFAASASALTTPTQTPLDARSLKRHDKSNSTDTRTQSSGSQSTSPPSNDPTSTTPERNVLFALRKV